MDSLFITLRMDMSTVYYVCVLNNCVTADNYCTHLEKYAGKALSQKCYLRKIFKTKFKDLRKIYPRPVTCQTNSTEGG